jgi:hypothetical protein
MTTQTEEQEMAFVEALRDYEDRWVAIIQAGGTETIVGSGRDAVEALSDAKARGFENAILFRVPPFNTTFIPLSVSICSVRVN